MIHSSVLAYCNTLTQDTSTASRYLTSGHLSDVSILSGGNKEYILKISKKNIIGYEYESDILQNFARSDEMYRLNEDVNHVHSYGIREDQGTHYHLQEYITGTEKNVLEYTRQEIQAIAQHMARIHTQTYAGTVSPYSVYRRAFRELITNSQSLLPSYELMTLENIDSSWFSQQIKKTYDLYMKIMKGDRNRPCVHLHGDFHSKNIIIGQDARVHLIDWSHIPYGDPGIDVGIFLTEIEIACTLQGKDYKSLQQIFLETYISETQDHNIVQYTQLSRLIMITNLLAPHGLQGSGRTASTVALIKSLLEKK